MSEAAIVISGLGLLMVYTVTILGGAAWLNGQLKTLKEEILKDFNKKHEDNNSRYEALNTLVIRHDILLNPEFAEARKNGRAHHG